MQSNAWYFQDVDELKKLIKFVSKCIQVVIFPKKIPVKYSSQVSNLSASVCICTKYCNVGLRGHRRWLRRRK